MLSNYEAKGRANDGKYVFESNFVLFTKIQFNLFS